MLFKICVFAVLQVLFLAQSANAQALNERNGIINGTLLQNLRAFPHEVVIYRSSALHCSGSILTSNWILTSQTCVYDNAYNKEPLTLIFNRLNISLTDRQEPESFTLQVSLTQVTRHNIANLALIHLPVALKFDINISPIALAIDRNESFAGRQAVMAGPKQNSTLLAYGTFEIITDKQCGAVYNWYNSSQEVCTLGWRNSSAVPCNNAQGGGLIVDWPSAPRLVGVFSAPGSCLSYVPAEYYKASAYLDWIEQTIGQHVKNDGYFL